MSFFNNWVQGIVIAVIITVIIEMILPEGNSKKYIKIVLGIYVVFSIIAPIIGNITGGSFEVSSIINMDKYAKELGTYEEMTKHRNIENSNNKNIKNTYIIKLKEDINTKLESKGYTTRKIELNIEDEESYSIKDITLYIDGKKKDNENDGESKQKSNKSINIVNEVKIDKVENINIGKEENKESTLYLFEKKDIIKFISETYGVDEEKIIVN